MLVQLLPSYYAIYTFAFKVGSRPSNSIYLTVDVLLGSARGNREEGSGRVETV